MASSKSRTKRNVMDVITFTIPGHDSYQMTVKEIVSKIEKDRIENMDEAVHTLIAVWTTIANRTENLSNVADIFHSLFRKTSLTILSVRWIKVTSAQKRQMAKVLTKCSQVFGPLVEKATRLCTVLVMAVYDPWGEPALNQLVEGQIDFTDTSVGEFVNSEPEELLLTRVESLTEAGDVNAAIQLCKSCLRHSLAIMTRNEENCHSLKKREKDKAYPFIENMLVLLHSQGDYGEIIKEAAKLKCHDGVNLIEEISSKCSSGDASLPEMLSHFFLARDISSSSNYCCTKELMNLWCKLQVMQQRNIQDISNSAQRLICHAPSSAYFYLFVDRLWRQFGNSLLPLYLEMYVRGITSDMNFLDVVRVAGPPEKTIEMESHLAFVFTKLASLFSGLYDEIALECLLTAYSFAPAKEKLDKIHKMKERVSKRINNFAKPFGKCVGTDNTGNLTGECTCEGRCSTPTRDNQNLTYPSRESHPVYTYHFPHLILDGEIRGVPYLLLKDFVSVLECMRYRHLSASDDWETIKRNCQEYLEKWAAPKTAETSCYDSADSEMDSVSEDGDDNTPEIKISRLEELPHEQGIYAQPLLSKIKKELKPKSHRKQKHRTEDAISLESHHLSKYLTTDNDIDKEIKKRKKKRKTKREKDREALKKQYEESNKAMLVHDNIINDTERQNRSPTQVLSSGKNEIIDVSSQEVKVLITQVNTKLSGGEVKAEDSSSPSGSIQNKNPVVVLSDILSDTIIDSSKNDCKNDFQHHESEKTKLPMELDIKKEIVLNEFEVPDTIVNPNDIVSPPQQILHKVMESNEACVETSSNLASSSLSTACQSNLSDEHKELMVVEQKSVPVTECKSVPVTECKSVPVTECKSIPITEYKSIPITECKSIPITECKSVPITECKSIPITECKSIPITECKSIPITECKSIPITECKSIPITECKSIPITECKSIPITECKSIPITEQKLTPVIEQKSYATNIKSENYTASFSVPTVRPDTMECPVDSKFVCVSNNSKDLSENEQEKNKDISINEPTIRVISTASSSSCTVKSIPLDSLPKKLQVQVERKSGIPSMSSMATLSIPLPVGVKHSSGNKVLSGRLVIPVNRLQRAVSSGSSNRIKIEGDGNCNKQQMLSIPNVILMKRSVSSDISDEETGSKKTNINKGSKNQKRMWATVRNLHGSIEWRKVSGNDGGIAFQQKPLCAKLRSGGVALSGPLYVSTGKEVDKNDLPLMAARMIEARNTSPSVLNIAENSNNVTSCSSAEYVQTTATPVPDLKLVSSSVYVTTAKTISVPVLSCATAETLQAAVTDVMSSRNDLHVARDSVVSNNSLPTTTSVTDIGIAHNALTVTQSSTIKPSTTQCTVSKKGHRLKFIAALDNTYNANITGILPVVPATAVMKEIHPLTPSATTDKGGAKNIIRLMPGGPNVCEKNIDFTRTLPTVSATNICPQITDTKCKSNFLEVSDSDLPVNLSMPKKPSTVCVDNKEFRECQLTFDNKQYPLRHSRVPSSSCKIDLNSSSIENNTLYKKASSTLQMLLANSAVSSAEQNKCSNQLASTMSISSTRKLSNAVDKSLSNVPLISSSSSRDLPLDFKNAYPNTNINCFVGLSPLSAYSSDEANLSAIVANNTSRMKKERIQNSLSKEDSCKRDVADNKEPFDVVKLIGQIRELANAEAEKAAKTKERRKSSQKDSANDNRNRKLSKKCLESNDKANPLAAPKKYRCVLCSSSLAQKYSLKRHYRDVHGLEVSPEQSSESIVKQFNDIASSRDGTYIIKNSKRNRTKIIPQTNVISGNLLSLADAAENEMQKTQQQTLPGVDVAFHHLNIFHQTSSHMTSLSSHHLTQNSVVPMFSTASTSTSYNPQQCVNSSVLKWSDNNQTTISSTENTLEALILDNTFYNNRVSDKPLPELGDCHSDLNESKHVVSAGDVSLSVPSSFCTDNINFKSTHIEHDSNSSRTVMNKNNESNLLGVCSNKNLSIANCERLQDIDRACRISAPERKCDDDNKMNINVTKEWSKDLKQISVNCIKLDKVYNQTTSNLEMEIPCINIMSSHSKSETNYQTVDCFSTYHNRKYGDRIIDGSSDNAVDSEVSKLVSYMYIDKKPYSQQKHLTENLREDSDGEVKIHERNLYKQEKSSEEKSETLKSVRQRTRVRHSPNSSLKRPCPCCQNSEASISAKRCRNISNVSRLARPPTLPWVNLERTNMQQRRSRKSLPPISTRSSKRLRTRSSTTSLT